MLYTQIADSGLDAPDHTDIVIVIVILFVSNYLSMDRISNAETENKKDLDIGQFVYSYDSLKSTLEEFTSVLRTTDSIRRSVNLNFQFVDSLTSPC